MMRQTQQNLVAQAFREFLETDLSSALTQRADPQAAALALFHQAATTIPAYQAFLAEHNLDPASIQTVGDFQDIPPVTKENYLRRHSLPGLCRNGRLEDCDMIAVS